MTVKEFKELIANLPDDVEIEINSIYENEEWFSSPIYEAYYSKEHNKVLLSPEIIMI